MDEQDRQIVNRAKRCTASDTERHLVLIIEMLDAENKKLKADLDRAVNALVKS